MKQFLTALTICFLTVFINNSFAETNNTAVKQASFQTTPTDSKKDSVQLKQEEVNVFVEQVVTSTTLKDFQQWCYKTMTAEKFDDFKQVYQVFLQQKFEEWVKTKEKVKSPK